MNKILIACVLVGSWEFAGAVHAPQFGNAVTEVMSVYLCLDAGGEPGTDGEPMKPSVGLDIRRVLEMGNQTIQAKPEYSCFVEGKLTDTWNCPGLRKGWESTQVPPAGSWWGGPGGGGGP